MSLEHTVYIVDDNAALCNDLSDLMTSSGIKTKQYASAEAFLEDYHPDEPGCLLSGMRMPGMSGLELQKKLTEMQACVSVIIMTGFADISMAVEAMKAGAIDFVEKPLDNQDILERIQASLLKSEKFFADCQQRSVVMERLTTLSEREREVMNLLVEGKHNKEIAAELNISTRTVEAHRAKVMEKLQANSLPDVVRMSLLV